MPPVGFEPKISAGERPCRSPAEILGLCGCVARASVRACGAVRAFLCVYACVWCVCARACAYMRVYVCDLATSKMKYLRRELGFCATEKRNYMTLPAK